MSGQDEAVIVSELKMFYKLLEDGMDYEDQEYWAVLFANRLRYTVLGEETYSLLGEE